MNFVYGIFDNITNQSLAQYSKDPEEWDWDDLCWDTYGRARNFQLFDSVESVLEALRHVEHVFSEDGQPLDFQVYRLYEPKTETTWSARLFEIPEEKSK